MVSELILSRVDEMLVKENPTLGKHGFRRIDDYTLYVASQGEAESALSSFQQALASYELEINPTKVRLEEISWSETPWVVEIRKSLPRDSAAGQMPFTQILDLFAEAAQFKRENPADGVMRYVTQGTYKLIDEAAASAYLRLVLSALPAEPTVLTTLFSVIAHQRHQGWPIDGDEVLAALEGLGSYHANLRHGYECAWILAILRLIGKSPSPTLAADFSKLNDNFTQVLLCDSAEWKDGIHDVDLTQIYRDAEDPDALYGANWLVAYQAGRRGRAAISNWPQEWKNMVSRRVDFLLDPTSPEAVAHAGQPAAAVTAGASSDLR